MRDNGGLIGPVNIPSPSNAKGKWNMEELYRARTANTWPAGFQASGGTETTSGGYRIHTFTSTNNFVVSAGSTSQADILAVGGGGGGGICFGAGGGAGSVVHASGFPFTPGTWQCVIGNGGSGLTPAQPGTAPNGQNSTINAGSGGPAVVTAFFGGGGGLRRRRRRWLR